MVVVSRAPTPTIEQQEVFRPVAAPVDTYVRPPDPAPSDLHNLARGLENFSRDIKGMFAAREARDAEAAKVRGEAQFFKDNQIGYAEAVRQGKIPAFQSRPFMEAYKEAEGKVIGARLASQMQLEYQTWEGRNSQDPANFDVFMADFLKRNLTHDDPDVLRGAMPYIYSTVNAGYTQRTQDAADATYNGGLNAQIAVNSMAIDEFSDNLDTDYDALWEELVANRGSALATGIRTLDYDSKLIDAIAAKALEAKDPALLALLDRPLPGQEHPISATPYGRDVKAKTISAMETINSQADNAAYTAQTRRDNALNDELTAFAMEAIFADPDVVLPDNFWAAYTKVEPEARVKIQEMRNAAIKGVQEDPELVSDLTYRILVGGEDPLTVLRNYGDQLDGSTVQKLYEMSQETPVWQNSQAYKIGLQTIQAKANEGNDLAINPNYVSPAASAASMDFELSMRAWAKTEAGQAALQNNDVAAIATEIGRVQGIIMGGFDSSMSEQATYTVPDEIVDIREDAGMPANPLAPTEAAMEEARAADLARQATPEGQMPEWTSGQVPDLNTLPEQEQTAIREEADRRGIDPQIFLEETYKQVDAIIKEVEAGAAIDQGIQDLLDNAPAIQAPGAPAPKGNLTPKSPQTIQEVVTQGSADPTYFDLEPSAIKDRTADTASNWNFGNLRNPNALVIHHTGGGGTVDGVVQTFKERGFPAHFVIDKEGNIHRVLRDDQKGQHTRPAEDGSDISNSNSWGVEIIAKDDSDLNPAQVRASIQLANYLHRTYGLPMDRVVGHGNINSHKQESEGDTVLAALDQIYGNSAPEPGTEGGGVENLLAFISQEEGTAGDDPYNIVYGGGTQPLTDMSLAQVRQVGKAVGKYQMMPDTIGDAQQALGLSPDTKFTPEVQEQIVMWLLERRGLGLWQDGRITDNQFIDNLSMEWAALSGSGGKAFYEGQGANASLPGLLAALDTVKK